MRVKGDPKLRYCRGNEEEGAFYASTDFEPQHRKWRSGAAYPTNNVNEALFSLVLSVGVKVAATAALCYSAFKSSFQISRREATEIKDASGYN